MLAIKSPGHYLQEAGLTARAGEYLQPYAQRILILTTPSAWRAVSEPLQLSLQQQGIISERLWLDGYCTEQAIQQVRRALQTADASLILAVGGGKVMDTAKAAAAQSAGVRLVMLPTQLATCAAWSPVSILYTPQGHYLRSHLLSSMPDLVLLDSEIIACSDVRYIKSGMIDALAKYYEFRPYQRNNPDNLSLQLKLLPAQQALEVIIKYGDQAITDNQSQRVTAALNKVAEANLVLAGLANSVRDSLATPGFAHALHNRLTRQPELHHWLHGEKVGFCLLVQSLLENKGQPEPSLLALLKRYGAPLRLPLLQGDRQQLFGDIAREVRFPAHCAAMLPFDISAPALEQALRLTDSLLFPDF